MANTEQINDISRNASADFLVLAMQGGESKHSRLIDGKLWISEEMLLQLYGTQKDSICDAFDAAYSQCELDVEDVRTCAEKGDACRWYSLSAVICMSYHIHSIQATEFRRYAAKLMAKFICDGYVIDKARMENGAVLGKTYFDKLAEELCEIRASGRRFYQKLTDLYETSVDYDRNSIITKEFYASLASRLHTSFSERVVHEDELLLRADAEQPNMGICTPSTRRVLLSDALDARSYLSIVEHSSLRRLVNMYLDIAEQNCREQIPMTMSDWVSQFNEFITMNEREILEFNESRCKKTAQKLGTKNAIAHAENEFALYSGEQDLRYMNDFDKLLAEVKK